MTYVMNSHICDDLGMNSHMHDDLGNVVRKSPKE